MHDAISGARRGEPVGSEVFKQRLADDFYKHIYRALRHDGHQAADAEDLTQLVYLHVLGKISKYQRQENVPFRAWLWKVSIYLGRSFRRDQQAKHSTFDQSKGASFEDLQLEPPNYWPDYDDCITDFQRASSRTWNAIRELCEIKEWNVLYRTVVEGKTAVEVSEELGISHAYVRQIKSRALKKCRSFLFPESH